MIRKIRSWTILSGLVLATALFVGAENATGQTTSTGQRLVFAKISNNPRDEIVGMRPLLDYIVEQLAPLGITEGDVVLARDQRQMISYLKQGKVDWVTESFVQSMLLASQTEASIELLRRKYGERSYRATVFVRSDSDIQSLDQLVGHTIAFEHPTSTSGYLLPAIAMIDAGVSLSLMASPRDEPTRSTAGYLFSYDEINTSTWVHKRITDAGAAADTDFNREFQVPQAFRPDFRIVYTSPPAPRGVELFNTTLSAEIRTALINALVSAEESEAGREVMRQFQGTSGYELYRSEEWTLDAALGQRLQTLADLY